MVPQAAASTQHDLTVISGLAVGILVMVLVSRMARKAALEAVAETGGKTP